MTALQEVKKRFLQNNKLTPILIGISREGIIRVDPKTKEVNILHCDPCFQLRTFYIVTPVSNSEHSTL